MIALGSTAFRSDLTPYALEQTAALHEEQYPEIAEEFHDFAVCFAEIENLPTFDGWVRGEDNGMDNLRRYV